MVKRAVNMNMIEVEIHWNGIKYLSFIEIKKKIETIFAYATKQKRYAD